MGDFLQIFGVLSLGIVVIAVLVGVSLLIVTHLDALKDIREHADRMDRHDRRITALEISDRAKAP